MPNNNTLYNAAYSGALAGLTSRWLKNESGLAASTTQAISSAVAFATMLDSLIAAGSFNQSDSDLLYSLCQSVWQDRMPISSTPSDYSEVAQTIVTIFGNSLANLQSVPSNDGEFIFVETVSSIAWVSTSWTGFHPVGVFVDKYKQGINRNNSTFIVTQGGYYSIDIEANYVPNGVGTYFGMRAFSAGVLASKTIYNTALGSASFNMVIPVNANSSFDIEYAVSTAMNVWNSTVLAGLQTVSCTIAVEKIA